MQKVLDKLRLQNKKKSQTERKNKITKKNLSCLRVIQRKTHKWIQNMMRRRNVSIADGSDAPHVAVGFTPNVQGKIRLKIMYATFVPVN